MVVNKRLPCKSISESTSPIRLSTDTKVAVSHSYAAPLRVGVRSQTIIMQASQMHDLDIPMTLLVEIYVINLAIVMHKKQKVWPDNCQLTFVLAN